MANYMYSIEKINLITGERTVIISNDDYSFLVSMFDSMHMAVIDYSLVEKSHNECFMLVDRCENFDNPRVVRTFIY